MGRPLFIAFKLPLAFRQSAGYSMTADSPPERARGCRSTVAESGLASILIGATVFLASPVMAILAAQIWAHADRTPSVVLLHAWLARLSIGPPILLVVFGIQQAIVGMGQASNVGCSRSLPLGGLLMNILALFSWLLAGIGLLNTTESMLRWVQ
jgi:hypothetical protein